MRRRTIRLIREWGTLGKSVLVSSHILHEIESMTSNILLINNGRILAEGNVHQIRELIDTHPHSVFIRAEDPKALARALLVEDGVISMRFEPVRSVETARPDAFYARSPRWPRRVKPASSTRSRRPTTTCRPSSSTGEAMKGFMRGAWRVFELSLGEMLWSRRTVFLAIVVGCPVLVAAVIRIVDSIGVAPLRINGQRMDFTAIFGVMIWVLFLRFIVPVLGVFYGTSLIADEWKTRPSPISSRVRFDALPCCLGSTWRIWSARRWWCCPA
jgi:hypothetical protein